MSWLRKYYEDVKRGKTIVHKFIKLDPETEEAIYEYEEVPLIVGEEMHMILDNLIEEMDYEEYRYDTTFSDNLIDFMENCIRLTKSPFYNVPMKLMLFQKAWIEALFSFQMYDEELKMWVDRFTETLELIARKNTKSETSSGLCDGIAGTGGEGMDIICASNTYDQALILYEACDTMRMLIDPNNEDTWRNRQGLTFTYNNNRIRTLSERTRNKEGRNVDIAVVDEVHEMKDDSLINPIIQSMSIKINKKLIMITTEGFTNDGYLDKALIAYRKIIKREDTSISAKRKLPWLYTQDSENEVWNTDENGISQAWQKSNPTLIYGVKKWSYLRERVEEARKSKSDRMFVLSKDFNFKVSNGQAWLLKEYYDYESTFNPEMFKNYWCIGCVDLAETTDLVNAKIIFIRKNDRKQYVLSHYWIPESKLEEGGSDDEKAGAKYREWASMLNGPLTITEGNDVDLSIVADWFHEQRMKYNLTFYKFGYDQKFKRDWINRMEYYGWVDKEDLIRIDQTPEILHTPIKQVEANLRDKLIVGLNVMDKWCLGNTALKVNSQEKSLLVKIDGFKAKRIDGAVNLVIGQETLNRTRSELLDYLPNEEVISENN